MGRHTEGRRRTPWLLIVMLAVVALGALVTAVALDSTHGGSTARRPGTSSAASSTTAPQAACPTTLRVVTARSFAPVLTRLAGEVAHGADCAQLQVITADGRGAAKVVDDRTADVWIPDDMSWLQLDAPAGVAGRVPEVLATSPLYLVTVKAPDNALPASTRTWAGLAAELAKQGRWHLVVADPAGSGDGMVAAGVLSTALFDRFGMLASGLDLVRAAQVGRTVAATALPRAPGEVGIVPEYVLTARADLAHYELFAPTDSVALLHYSWLAIRTSAGDTRRAAALSRLRAAFGSPSGTAALDAAGLRPGGRWPAAPQHDVSGAFPALPSTPYRPLVEHFMWHVLTTYERADRRANMLIVVDVSGSMADPPPGSHTPLIALVRDGVRQLSALLPDSSRLGLWKFGSHLDGPRDFQVLVPSAALDGRQRAGIDAAGRGLAAQQTGTGLYDTVLAAYQAQQAGFQPGIPNEVLVFTDGVNEDDPGSITLEQLRAGLAGADPDRHVDLEIFAFGNRVPPAVKPALAPVRGKIQPLSSAQDVLAAFVHATSADQSH